MHSHLVFCSGIFSTALGILFTVVFATPFKLPSPQDLGISLSQAPAYLMTLPYHPLLNLLWLPFAWMYLHSFELSQKQDCRNTSHSARAM